MSRYNSRKRAVNAEEIYEKVLEDRGVKRIVQYTTHIMKSPTEEQRLRIRTLDHVWKQGDRYWLLASRNYGNPSYWWVIAQYNERPTESHNQIGDVIKIPINLDVVLGVLG